MTIKSNTKPFYELEERTIQFAKEVRLFVKKLPNTISNQEDGKQVIRASGSIGANYIEANESLSKKDFVYRIKVCLKESKESSYFLRLIKETNPSVFEEKAGELFAEAIELKKIFASIVQRSK